MMQSLESAQNVFSTFIQMYSALVVFLAGHREEIPTFHIHQDADHICCSESFSFYPKSK